MESSYYSQVYSIPSLRASMAGPQTNLQGGNDRLSDWLCSKKKLDTEREYKPKYNMQK